MLDQIFIGLIGIAAGIVAVIYARKIVESFGTMATWENMLGTGGTYSALRIFGVLITLISFLYMFGLLDNVILGFLRGIGLAS